MNTMTPARKRGRPPGTTRPSKPNRKIKTGIAMAPDEWATLDELCRIHNTSRGVLIAQLAREKTARPEGN